MNRRFSVSLHHMPFGGEFVGLEGSGRFEGRVEYFAEQPGDFWLVKDQHVVCLDVDSTEAKIRRAHQHLKGFAIALGDQHLVMLELLEVRSLNVSCTS